MEKHNIIPLAEIDRPFSCYNNADSRTIVIFMLQNYYTNQHNRPPTLLLWCILQLCTISYRVMTFEPYARLENCFHVNNTI